uniref:non-specific serine/threonine protein kinase n=1 Tax=viral metagenome TaxID=1070528 RepID=A0A6C0C9R5_9ZZZZ
MKKTARSIEKVVVSESSSYEQDDSNSSQRDSDEELPLTDEIIYPGLILNGDYVLIKKIGYGNNAGVWMTYKISTKSYFAIKIQDYQCYDDGCREIKILKKVAEFMEKNKSHKTYCINMLECFKYSEEHNDSVIFVCSVYDLYAGSINTPISTGVHKYGLPINVVKKITKQLLTALSVLHNELNVIHTDIKPENILLKGVPTVHNKIIKMFEETKFHEKYDVLAVKFSRNPKKFNEKRNMLALACVANLEIIEDAFICRPTTLSDEEEEDSGSHIEGEEDDFEDVINKSESEEAPASTKLNKRSQSVDDLPEFLDYKVSHSLEEFYDHESVINNKKKTTDHKVILDEKYINDCEIAVTDFGNSYFYDRRTKNEIQDRRYRAPEIVLNHKYGYSCDIWSVGCVVFELLTGFTLFSVYDSPLSKDIHHLFLMEKMLGPLPLNMKKSSSRAKFLFDAKNNYSIKNVDDFDMVSIYDRLVKQFLFSKADALKCSDFILAMLKYSPARRPTASEMLKHEWLKNI